MSKKKSSGSPFASLAALRAEMQAEAATKPDGAKKTPRARASVSAVAPKPPAVEVWRPENFDRDLFDVAMAGVRPLEDAPRRVTGHEGARSPNRERLSVETKLKQALAAGGPELEVRWNPDGTVSAARPGRNFAVMALERFAQPDETLDLHGLDATTAGVRVVEFVRSRRARGRRCVAVVHGRGQRSPEGAGVLLDAVVNALRVPPAANELDGFATAPDALGGRGALLIALRSG